MSRSNPFCKFVGTQYDKWAVNKCISNIGAIYEAVQVGVIDLL